MGGSPKFWRESKVLERVQSFGRIQVFWSLWQCFCRDFRFGGVPRLRSGFSGVCGIPEFRRDSRGLEESFKGFSELQDFERDLRVTRDLRVLPEGSPGFLGITEGF